MDGDPVSAPRRQPVDLVLTALIHESTSGICEPGRRCDMCDCFAGPATWQREWEIAEKTLAFGLDLLREDKP